MISKNIKLSLVIGGLTLFSSCDAGAGKVVLSGDSVAEYLFTIENPKSLSHLARSPALTGFRWGVSSNKILIYTSVLDFTTVASAQSFLGGIGLFSYVRAKCANTPLVNIAFEAQGALTGHVETEIAGNNVFVPYMLFNQAEVDAYARTLC